MYGRFELQTNTNATQSNPRASSNLMRCMDVSDELIPFVIGFIVRKCLEWYESDSAILASTNDDSSAL
jgi:hypothetical protein